MRDRRAHPRHHPTPEELTARSLVITAGHGTNDVLAASRAHASTCRSPATVRSRRGTSRRRRRRAPSSRSAAMPVIAYLDAGIYCHPIVEGLVDKVKIGYYHPPDLPRSTTAIDSVAAFVEHCLPGLRDARSEPVRRLRRLRLRPGRRRRVRPRTRARLSGRARWRRLARYGLQVRALGRPRARRARAAAGHGLRHRPLRPGPVHERSPAMPDRPSSADAAPAPF